VGELERRVNGLESLISQFRSEIHGELRAFRDEVREVEARLRDEIRTGDEESRRFMRILHEDLVDRIKTLGEGGPFRRP
jgi:hypothetical protein